MKSAGVSLVILGIAALAFQGVVYATTQKAVDIGPLQITKRTENRIPLPPVAGAAAVVGGAAMLFAGSREGKGASAPA